AAHKAGLLDAATLVSCGCQGGRAAADHRVGRAGKHCRGERGRGRCCQTEDEIAHVCSSTGRSRPYAGCEPPLLGKSPREPVVPQWRAAKTASSRAISRAARASASPSPRSRFTPFGNEPSIRTQFGNELSVRVVLPRRRLQDPIEPSRQHIGPKKWGEA